MTLSVCFRLSIAVIFSEVCLAAKTLPLRALQG